MPFFLFPNKRKQSLLPPDAGTGSPHASSLANSSTDPQSGDHLDEPTATTQLDTRDLRNVGQPRTNTESHRLPLIGMHLNPGSRRTPDVVSQISAAVLRQHRALNNLSPDSRARLPLHLRRMRSIPSFEPAEDINLNCSSEVRNTDIPIILTTFHTGSEDTQATALAKSETARAGESKPSGYAWLELDASDSEEGSDETPAPQIRGERRPPSDTSWLGDWRDTPRPVLARPVVARVPELKRSGAPNLLPIAAEFASSSRVHPGHAQDSGIPHDRAQIENTKSESTNARFKVIPRNAIPSTETPPTPQLLPSPDRVAPVREWLTGVALGRSGETPSTSESGRTKSMETTSTANTTPRLREQVMGKSSVQEGVETKGPVARHTNSYTPRAASVTPVPAQSRFCPPNPRLNAIVNLNPPRDYEPQQRPPPARY